jgi:hypothetical protein
MFASLPSPVAAEAAKQKASQAVQTTQETIVNVSTSPGSFCCLN